MAAEEGQVIGVHSVDAWKAHLQSAIESKKLVEMRPGRFDPSPLFAETAKKFPHVMFLKVDVDELKSVAEEWDVEAMPTFIFLKEGNLIDKIVGAPKDLLVAKITKYAGGASASA